MPYYVTGVEKIIDYAICSYLAQAPKGLENGHGFINLNKWSKCIVLITLLPFRKKRKEGVGKESVPGEPGNEETP